MPVYDDLGRRMKEFFEMVDELDKRLNYDKENTSLPDNPDYNRINEFVASVNERIVRGEIYNGRTSCCEILNVAS